MGFNQKQTQNQKQLQRLIMLPQMQQALSLMQMPILELSQVVEAELEQNPVLEYDEELPDPENKEQELDIESPAEEELKFNDDFDIMRKLDEDFRDHFSESENYYIKRSVDEEKLKSFLEQSVPSQETLFEYLMKQSKEVFEFPQELGMAEILIGSLDEKGYLSSSLIEISDLHGFDVENLAQVLSQIQTFEPLGVGARNLRECFLIQLIGRGETKSLAYQIIDLHFDDLLHNNMPQIKKGLNCTIDEIQEAIHRKISHLDLHPGLKHSQKPTQHIVPDVTVSQDDEKLNIMINDDRLPTVRLNTRYLRMLDDESLPKETKDFIRNKLMSAKWLLKNIDQRNETIYRVVESISKHQKEFFMEPHGKLQPMTMKMIADELALHESTIARSVSNKYLETPKGLFPMRYFFSNSFTTAEGVDISSKTVRELLKKMIEKENKKRPLSDEALSKLLEKKGVPCARRTVAKYRNEMQIGNVKQRKAFS